MLLAASQYITKINLSLNGQIHFNKPYTEGFTYEVPKGTELIVSVWTEPQDELVQVFPKFPKKHESSIVGDEFLSSSFYNSYSFLIEREALSKKCENTTDFSSAIYFYSPNEENGYLSNFSKHGIEIDEIYYPTVEHYFQAQKFDVADYKRKIIEAESPKRASELERSRHIQIREGWEEIKNSLMRKAVQLKFERHKSLKKSLLETEGKLLIENSPYDNYWGIGSSGNGLNQLGAVLMQVRQLLG